MCVTMLTPAFATENKTEPQQEVEEALTENLSNNEDNNLPAEDGNSDADLTIQENPIQEAQATDLPSDGEDQAETSEETDDLQTEPDETNELKKEESSLIVNEEPSEQTGPKLQNGDELLPADEEAENGDSEFEVPENAALLGPEMTTAMQPTAVFAAARTTNLNIDHVTNESDEKESSSDIELKKDEMGFVTAFVKIEDESIDMGEDFKGTGWYNYGKVSLEGVEFPKDPAIKETVPLEAPIYTEINGNKVCWTTLKYESDGWHLDGAITYPTNVGVISVQDKTGSFSGETEISEIRNGWHNLNAEELHEILGPIDLPAASPDQPPAVSAEISKKINDYLASKGWSGGSDSISWKYTYAGNEGWHLDGYLNVEKQEVSTVVSDPSGSLYEASNGQIDYAKWNDNSSYWHDIAKDEFLLPDPGTYKKGDTISLTPTQLKQVQDKFAEVTGWNEAGDKDGTIEWKFSSQRDSAGNARWDLQGIYVPDTISIYVYMAGAPNMEGTTGTNGNKLSETVKETLGTDQEWANEWYTAGKIKLPLTEELRALFDDNDLSGIFEYVKTNGAGLLSIYEPNQAFWADKNFNSLEWHELSVDAGARDYLNKTNYKTLHLNGIFRNPSTTEPENPNNPPKGEDPNNPSGSGENPPINPPGGEEDPSGPENQEPVLPPEEEPVVPPEEIDPIVPPIIIEDGGDDSDTEDSEPVDPLLLPKESLITIEDQQTPLTMLPKELWVTSNYTPCIYGRTDSTLNPDETLLRNEFAVMLFRLLSEDAHATFDTSKNEYTDVAITAWYNDAVSTLTSMGILEGFYDGGYHPAEMITRDAFIKALAVMFEIPEDFTFDASSSDHITRAEAVVIINQLLGWEKNGDLTAGHTHYIDVNEETPNYWDLMIASSKNPEGN